MSMSYEKVMAILEDVMNEELEHAKNCENKEAYDVYMGHVNGINWAISRIRREEKES